MSTSTVDPSGRVKGSGSVGYLPKTCCHVGLQVDGVDEHVDRLGVDEALGEELGDAIPGLLGDPVVDRGSAALRVALQVQGVQPRAVVGGEGIEVRLSDLAAGPGPAAVAPRPARRHRPRRRRGRATARSSPRGCRARRETRRRPRASPGSARTRRRGHGEGGGDARRAEHEVLGLRGHEPLELEREVVDARTTAATGASGGGSTRASSDTTSPALARRRPRPVVVTAARHTHRARQPRPARPARVPITPVGRRAPLLRFRTNETEHGALAPIARCSPR